MAAIKAVGPPLAKVNAIPPNAANPTNPATPATACKLAFCLPCGLEQETY